MPIVHVHHISDEEALRAYREEAKRRKSKQAQREAEERAARRAEAERGAPAPQRHLSPEEIARTVVQWPVDGGPATPRGGVTVTALDGERAKRSQKQGGSKSKGRRKAEPAPAAPPEDPEPAPEPVMENNGQWALFGEEFWKQAFPRPAPHRLAVKARKRRNRNEAAA